MELEWDNAHVQAVLSEASLDGLRLAAEHLLQVSSSRAPLEEGDLERSGDIDTDEVEIAVSVYFDRPYAVRQHEELTWRHDAGRTAKYLEDPMNEEAETMAAIIAKAAGHPLS
ncbi:hypothetical protein J2S43_007859 [Catenuloplanes nepalensis]|uniref:Uncharacterized protein n=1 Tax=Catenuloplanes nepalensis TaxID=587533 RepID=A0ABT9N6M1_9ACTN|nr:hypothetical protein [Catenuloplanes nepalensis]MDP9799347.1 hypothetical protein [Catenuloplanes nepalensis]